MHFELNEEQILIQESAKKFAMKKLCPIAAGLERPENREIYLEQIQGLSSQGLMGLTVDSAYGGAEAGVIAFSVALTEISKACASTGVAMSVNNLVAEVIQIIGSREQKETYIPRICSGEYTCGAFCLSESEAGSDPSRLKTRPPTFTTHAPNTPQFSERDSTDRRSAAPQLTNALFFASLTFRGRPCPQIREDEVNLPRHRRRHLLQPSADPRAEQAGAGS